MRDMSDDDDDDDVDRTRRTAAMFIRGGEKERVRARESDSCRYQSILCIFYCYADHAVTRPEYPRRGVCLVMLDNIGMF